MQNSSFGNRRVGREIEDTFRYLWPQPVYWDTVLQKVQSTCFTRTSMWIKKLGDQATGNGIQCNVGGKQRSPQKSRMVHGMGPESKYSRLQQGDGGFHSSQRRKIGLFSICFERNLPNLNKLAHIRRRARTHTHFTSLKRILSFPSWTQSEREPIQRSKTLLLPEISSDHSSGKFTSTIHKPGYINHSTYPPLPTTPFQ